MAMNQPGSSLQTVGQEYVVKIPKNTRKKFNMMKFNAALNVDFANWATGPTVRLDRENNMKMFKVEEEGPKFGMGSEFGKEQREEARRRKYGAHARQYKPEDQPWILKTGGRGGKKFRGVREGDVSKNASFYVFVQGPDGSFEAYPVDEWYNFTPVTTYRTLDADEAEAAFGKRDKVLNFFSIMVNKKLRKTEDGGDGDDDEDNKDKKKKKPASKYGKGSGDLKISDMDEWIGSSEEEMDEEGGEGTSDKEGKKEKDKKNQKPKKKKKKKKENEDDDSADADEDSDDGDEEGRELDYISDSSSEEEQERGGKDEMKGVEDEDAIKKMEDSEEEEEEEDKNKEGTEENKEPEKPVPGGKEKKGEGGKKDGNSSSDSGSDTSDSDDFDSSYNSAMFMQNPKSKSKGSSSRSNTPTKAIEKKVAAAAAQIQDQVDNKRAGTPTLTAPASKKRKMDTVSTPTSSANPSSSMDLTLSPMDRLSEEAVRRYLMRKPMNVKELLQKFKSKKTGITNDQIVTQMTQILKKLNPDRQTIKGTLYFSMKSSS